MTDHFIPVRVALRTRPLIQREVNEGCQTCLSFNSEEPQVILGKDKAFTFDYVFSPSNSQQDVYNQAAKKLVTSIFEGYNATVLAYGQTGSGKTHSMGGCYEASLNQDEVAMGIIPRILIDVFNGISERPEYTFKVTVSYLEIYKEELLDLLCEIPQRQQLSIREEQNGEIKIKGLKEVTVNSLEDTLQCLTKGAQSRTVGATAMNDTSSRSHAIFTIHMEKVKKDDQEDLCVAKFHLVDLAGSERAKRTRAEGDRFKEGVNINRGLLALGNVISALGEDTQRKSHIPYRDSKLTRLLQDSLGGNSHTLMVACVSPADSSMEETLNTLRYADRARKIKNKPVINRDRQSDEILRLRQVVLSLQSQLSQNGIGGGSLAVDDVDKNGSVDTVNRDCRQQVLHLTEQNQMLDKENRELVQELEHAVEQNSRHYQAVTQLEASYEKLKTKLQSLKQDSCVDFELLSSSLDVESNPQVKEELDKLQRLTDNVNSDDINDKEEDKEDYFNFSDRKEETNGDGHENDDSFQDCQDMHAKSKKHVLRQAKMSRELHELTNILAKKQELAGQMNQSEDKMASLRSHYESLMKGWEDKVNQLQKEKEKLNHALSDVRANRNASKVSEMRRKRLQDLEHEISDLKRKMVEQSKAVKLGQQTEKQINLLNTEILNLKQQRVKLMKQIKEEGDHWRKWKQQKDREVLQLIQKDRKRQAEVARQQQANEKQQAVLKRKLDEAVAANKRLKDALAGQKAMAEERAVKPDSSDSTFDKNHVKKLLNHELEVRVSLREARYHMTSLIADRTVLTQRKRELEEKMSSDAPVAKKFSCEAENGERSENSFQEEGIKKEIEELSAEIELRNVEIQDLQQKICDADQGIKDKPVCEVIQNTAEAMCALNWLLEQAVEGKADCTNLQEQLKCAKEVGKDKVKKEQRMEEELQSMKKVFQEELLQQSKDHQQKTLVLLGLDQHNGTKATTGDEELRKKLEIMSAELDKMSAMSEELERKSAECEELQKKVAGIRNGETDSPYKTSFLTPRPAYQLPNQNGRKRRLADETPKTPGYVVETDDDWDGDDNGKNTNWRFTPHHKRQRTPNSSSVMNNTFSIDDNDDPSLSTTKPRKAGRTQGSKIPCKKTSHRRVADIVRVDNVRSSDEFEKPATFTAKGPKRTRDHTSFIHSQEFMKQNSKRRRTLLRTISTDCISPSP